MRHIVQLVGRVEKIGRHSGEFAHTFADILWGFSGLMFPATHEIQNWAALQVIQIVISAVMLMDLMSKSKRQGSYEPKLQASSVSA